MSAQAMSATKLLSQAQSARRTGAHGRARALYSQVLARYPSNRRARDGLDALDRPDPDARQVTQADLDATIALYRAGEFTAALTRADALARLSPNLPAVCDLRAACHRALGAPDRAAALYRRALDTRPTEAPLWRNLGAVLIELRQTGDAATALERACQLSADDVQNWTALAACRLELGHYRRALAASDAAVQGAPDSPAALNLRGDALRHLGALDLAQDAHERASILPGPRDQIAEAHNHLGILATARGTSDAANQFQAAIALRPGHTAAHLSLSRITRYTPDHPHLRQIETLLLSENQSPIDRARLHFAAFEAHDQLDNIETAWRHLQQANTLRRAALRYDPNRDATLFDYLTSLEFPNLTETAPGPRPIFVLGLPRSGTTLTEQILAGVPGTHAAGELSVVASAVADLLRAENGAHRITPDQMATFSANLRAGLSHHAKGKPVIIDKMPLNFRWAGLVLAALPDACVVHVARDARSTCWSLYRTCFASGGNSFAYDLDDLVRYYSKYRALMGHWQARFADRIIPLSYEALTTAPEREARAVITRCGLDWSDACAAPHRANRPVLTASAQQVRQPIHATRNAAWRRYAPYLTAWDAAFDT
ncbi:sulfotransferase [Rhodobacteraceae bacterium KMM 6894]|nr:sulfotransferase [Rhodobacteraceae bacterium KMM 6894]